MWSIPCDFGTDEEEFKKYVGRKPLNGGEMSAWCHYLKKGVDAQLDWEIIGQCAADEFKRGGKK